MRLVRRPWLTRLQVYWLLMGMFTGVMWQLKDYREKVREGF
jgi:hypothetical protein